MSVSPERMAGLLDGTGTATMPDAADLLAQLGQDDPRMAALCRFFVQRQADAANAAADPVPEAAPAGDVDALAKLEARHARLREIAGAMQRELRVLRDRDAIAAAALGACEACWGRDAACAHCGGRGRPGFDAPDPALYARLVAPAVRRLMRRREPQRLPTPAAASIPDRAADGFAAGPLD